MGGFAMAGGANYTGGIERYWIWGYVGVGGWGRNIIWRRYWRVCRVESTRSTLVRESIVLAGVSVQPLRQYRRVWT